jgi:hypothetical protein
LILSLLTPAADFPFLSVLTALRISLGWKGSLNDQIGFKEDSRTTDHIFTLKSIIENYESQKKKVFAAFIDLRKAFDTV